MITIAVTGGRHFGCFTGDDGKLVVVKPERDFIYETLTAVAGFDANGEPNPVKIMHGACPTGADKVADAWARKNMMPVERHPADWKRFGLAAGPKRNQEMANRMPDYCIAFPGKAGTKDMVTKCNEAGIFVLFPQWDRYEWTSPERDRTRS